MLSGDSISRPIAKPETGHIAVKLSTTTATRCSRSSGKLADAEPI